MKQLEKVYDPSQVEDRLYRAWQESGVFHTQRDARKKALYHCDAAAQYYGPAAHGPRHGRDLAGHPHPL